MLIYLITIAIVMMLIWIEYNFVMTCILVIMNKECSKCNNIKEITEFPKLGAICKMCKAAYLRILRTKPGQKEKRTKYRNENRDKINKIKRDSYRRHSDCIKKKNNLYYHSNADHCKKRQKDYMIKKETADMISWLAKCYKHCKHKDTAIDIDLKYLIELYQKQNKRCAISNILLTHNRNDLLAASIDRIDSNLPHIKSNVQLICSGLNRAKREYSDDDVYNMLESFANEYNSLQIKDFKNFEYPEQISNYNILQKKKLKQKLVEQFEEFIPPQYSDEILMHDFMNIDKINIDDYFVDNKLYSFKQSNTTWPGKKIIWNFQKDLWNVKTQGKPLIKEIWCDHDSKIFNRAINNLINGTSITYDRVIREFVFAGVGITSQMHTGFAKAIISKFNINNLPVYDPFAGWGARLLASNSLKMKYIATELSNSTYNGLLNIANKFNINCDIKNCDYKLYIPSSDVFMFTSPPFGSEEYINSDNNINHVDFLEITKNVKTKIIHINKDLYDIYKSFDPSKIIEVNTKSSASSSNNIDYLMIWENV